MSLLEDDARKKWCPFERSGNVHAGNMSGTRDVMRRQALCIASECMAWRWTSNDRELSGPNAKIFGYCGLAGKP